MSVRRADHDLCLECSFCGNDHSLPLSTFLSAFVRFSASGRVAHDAGKPCIWFGIPVFLEVRCDASNLDQGSRLRARVRSISESQSHGRFSFNWRHCFRRIPSGCDPTEKSLFRPHCRSFPFGTFLTPSCVFPVTGRNCFSCCWTTYLVFRPRASAPPLVDILWPCLCCCPGSSVCNHRLTAPQKAFLPRSIGRCGRGSTEYCSRYDADGGEFTRNGSWQRHIPIALSPICRPQSQVCDHGPASGERLAFGPS